jgi:1-acyl-sn-glycerol-3-phosphate acyltransferase
MLRMLLFALRRFVADVQGLERISPQCDPFILAPNHSQKIEALLLPALLIFSRGGKRIHFLSDWNFRMIPVLASMLRRSGTIILMNKSARPRFLNVLKPWFDPGVPGWVRAQEKLKAGCSVGVYPEGTLNRNPSRLLKGYSGASKLSLLTQTPVVPVGISFPNHPQDQLIRECLPMAIQIGDPMVPPSPSGEPSLAEIRDWHHHIMLAVARLSHKEWQPQTKRRSS